MKILKPRTANSSTTPAKGSPFFALLTDDGTDNTLNEDYSSSPADMYWTCPANAHLHTLSFTMGEDSIGQSSAIVNTTVGNSGLSNGLKFAIKNPAGTIIQDITVTSIPVSTAQLMALGSSSTFLMSLFDGSTAGNNEIILAVEINFIEKFGGVLFIPKNHRIVCTLNNNFSVLSALQIGVSGVYV